MVSSSVQFSIGGTSESLMAPCSEPTIQHCITDEYKDPSSKWQELEWKCVLIVFVLIDILELTDCMLAVLLLVWSGHSNIGRHISLSRQPKGYRCNTWTVWSPNIAHSYIPNNKIKYSASTTNYMHISWSSCRLQFFIDQFSFMFFFSSWEKIVVLDQTYKLAVITRRPTYIPALK